MPYYFRSIALNLHLWVEVILHAILFSRVAIKPFTESACSNLSLYVWLEVILHAILFSPRNQPDQTFHCMDGGNIACHIIFVEETA